MEPQAQTNETETHETETHETNETQTQASEPQTLVMTESQIWIDRMASEINRLETALSEARYRTIIESEVSDMLRAQLRDHQVFVNLTRKFLTLTPVAEAGNMLCYRVTEVDQLKAIARHILALTDKIPKP